MIEREKLVVFPGEKEGTPHIYSGCGRLTVLGNMGLLSCTGELEVYKTGEKIWTVFDISQGSQRRKIFCDTPLLEFPCLMSLNGFVGNV